MNVPRTKEFLDNLRLVRGEAYVSRLCVIMRLLSTIDGFRLVADRNQTAMLAEVEESWRKSLVSIVAVLGVDVVDLITARRIVDTDIEDGHGSSDQPRTS